MSLVVENTPEILAWPQLPRRSFLEHMYVQYSEGLPGRIIDASSEVILVKDEVPPEEFVAFLEQLESGDPEAFGISAEYAAGLGPLRAAIAEHAVPFVKGQVVGPVSFALAVTNESRRALLYDETLLEVSTRLVGAKALWQERLLREWAPDSDVLIVFDEPYLTQLGSGFVSLPEEAVYPTLEQCMSPLTCLCGIHVCGGTDWTSIVEELPVDLLSFDAADHLDSIAAHSATLSQFVRDGGILAWGAVPNDARAWELKAEAIVSRVLKGAHGLAGGSDMPVSQVLAQSFVSPACGTGTLSEELAERCFSLTASAAALLRMELERLEG